MNPIRTERLDLTPAGHEDVAHLRTLLNHPDVGRYLLDGNPVPVSWVEKEIEGSRRRFEAGSCGLWVARPRDAESRKEAGPASIPVTGMAGFRPFFDPPELQLLYAIHPRAWGRGLATEAARAVRDFAFRELGFEEVVAATDEPNTASAAVLSRLGMELWKTEEGTPHRTLFFRITRDEWEALPAGGEAPGTSRHP